MPMDKRKYEAAKILDPQWYPIYEAHISAIYSQAIELNSCIFILEKILAFPFRLFGVRETPFWVLTVNSFFQAAVMCSWRIAVDSGGDFLTLKKFKNDLIQQVVDPSAKAELIDELRRVHFEKRLNAISTKITTLRHTLVAHYQPSFLVTAQGKTPTEIPRITLGDLQKVRDAVNELIQLFGFDMGYLFLPIEYEPIVIHPPNADPRPDIVKLLDSLAEASPILHMPETRPAVWPYRRKKMSMEELTMYNQYRRKFSLQEVP